MYFKSIVFLLLFINGINSFIFNKNNCRRNIILQSHFSIIPTEFNDKKLLIQSLLDINPYLKIDNGPDLILNYNGSEVIADIIIRQKNGMDIGFCLKGNSYHIVADLQFWQQSLPPDVFIKRLKQKYSINSILEDLDDEGYYA